MNSEQLHALAPLYAADALDEEERALFESHLPSCEQCRHDVRTFGDAMTAALEPDVDRNEGPSPDLRAQVLSTIAQTPQVTGDEVRSTSIDAGSRSEIPPVAPVTSLADRRRRIERLVLAAAAVVVIAVGGVLLGLRLGQDDPVDLVADAPDAETLELEGEAGTLTVIYSASLDKVALLGEGLTEPGAGEVYELWFVTDDGVSPAALFTPESGVIQEVFPVDDQAGTAGFGVTIEPAGGSDQPTGDILLVGTFEA